MNQWKRNSTRAGLIHPLTVTWNIDDLSFFFRLRNFSTHSTSLHLIIIVTQNLTGTNEPNLSSTVIHHLIINFYWISLFSIYFCFHFLSLSLFTFKYFVANNKIASKEEKKVVYLTTRHTTQPHVYTFLFAIIASTEKKKEI